MAATPPLQIREDIPTPASPLHGAAYLDSPPQPQSTRLSQRRISQEAQATPEAAQTPRKRRSFGTPGSSRRPSQNSHSDLPLSPRRTSPRNKNPARRVQILSPSSPDFGPAVPKSFTSSSSRPTIFSSTTTTVADGMLPTPVKTPKKTTVPKINAAARALFQDKQIMGEEFAPAPRRARKQKRYNGFSLETFDGEDVGRGRIQIFTDSRDQVPQADTHEDNPFIDPQANQAGPSVKKVAGGSKRRKISGEKKKDPQVAEAIKNDEGMVYVFRGKKVFRKFDDADDEEEVIDAEDLGLLEHTSGGSESFPHMKTSTRKSIRPKRLFQTEQQKRAREIEKEEEAATDIEDYETTNPTDADVPVGSVKGGMEVIDLVTPAEHGHSLRSTTQKDVNGNKPPTVCKAKAPKATKKASPFDAWRRLKSVGKSVAGTSSKSKKRDASEMEGDGSIAKRVKSD